MFELSAQVKEGMADVAIAAMGLAGAYATYFIHQATSHIKEKTKTMKDQSKAVILLHAMDQVDNIATKVVDKTEQTIASELRAKVKSGEVDRQELLALGEKAVSEVINTMAPDVLHVLSESLGDYRAYIESTVESKVRQVKQEASASTTV